MGAAAACWPELTFESQGYVGCLAQGPEGVVDRCVLRLSVRIIFQHKAQAVLHPAGHFRPDAAVQQALPLPSLLASIPICSVLSFLLRRRGRRRKNDRHLPMSSTTAETFGVLMASIGSDGVWIGVVVGPAAITFAWTRGSNRQAVPASWNVGEAALQRSFAWVGKMQSIGEAFPACWGKDLGTSYANPV